MDLLISSSDRSSILSTSSSQFTVEIPGGLPVKEGNVKLLDVQFPNTMYNIVSGYNNVIVWSEGSTNYSLTLSPGYFSTAQLISNLNTGMNNIISNSYSWTYSNITMRFSVSGGIPFSLNWVSSPYASQVSNRMAQLLGFSVKDTPSASATTGDKVAQMQGPEKLLITISQLTSQGKTSSGIYYTFCFPVNAPSGYLASFPQKASFDQEVKCGQLMISSLNISLRYMDGTLADLGGSDWNFLLRIE